MTGSVRILHVDDEPGFADVVADLLERENDRFDVRTESNAEDALRTLRERDVDCIVSDHDMPGMDGIEFLETIRADDPDVPFILFTGKGSEEVASKAVSAGVTDYLQKESGTDHYALLANRIENVVERFRSERAARHRKRQLETLVSNLPGIVYRCHNEPGWPMEYVAGECEALTGYPSERIEDGDVRWGRDVIHPDDREAVWESVQEALGREEPFQCTYRIRTDDGDTRWVWERGRVVGASSDGIEALEGLIMDVSESKRRERRFEAIFNNSYQFTGLLEPDGTIIEANDTALSFAGVDREDIVGEKLRESAWFRKTEKGKRIAREAVETARNGEFFREKITIKRDDERRIVDFSVRPVTDESGAVTLLIPEGRDITELEERKRELRRTERRFDAIFDDPHLLFGLLDADGTTRDVNETAVEYVDATRGEVVGEPFWETPWWTDDHRNDVKRWIDEAAAGEYVEYEARHPTGDGRHVVVEGSFRPVTDDAGTVTAIVVSAKDVTERNRRRRELRRRNERVDEFASLVSHDLQAPISTARGRLDLAVETGETAHVEKARDAVDRIDDLRTDIVHTLHTGDVVSETTTVGIESVVADVWSTIDPPGTASFGVESALTVEADPEAFQRMLENLVGNSIEHGGDDVDVHLGSLDDGLFYEDDGPGIDPEYRERVFAPGFSTKKGSDGIGMGMASVRQIVLAHDWEIRVDDAELLDGVRFEIRTEPDARD